MGRPKLSFGMDPGINHIAIAAVDEDGHVTAGVVRNPAKSAKGWAKLYSMIKEIEKEKDLMTELQLDVAVIEGQYSAKGRGSPDHQIRNGWISAIVWYLVGHSTKERLIALPQVWTKGVPKEIRHEKLRPLVDPVEDWEWFGEVPPSGMMKDVWDAVGLAVWGLDQIGCKL